MMYVRVYVWTLICILSCKHLKITSNDFYIKKRLNKSNLIHRHRTYYHVAKYTVPPPHFPQVKDRKYREKYIDKSQSINK